MDRQKLLRIIVKDLEELKFLSEEITENEGESNLVIDLALSKARLLCQEIEVLKEISFPSIKKAEEAQNEDEEEDTPSSEEEETISVAEPELEILNFEQPDFEEEEEEEEEADEDLAEDEDEIENTESEQEQEPIFEVAGEEETEEQEEEEVEEEEEEELNDEEELEDFEEEIDDLDEDADEKPEPETEDTPLAEEPKVEFREITLDDDDEIETIPVSNMSEQKAPVFREIPKPEEPVVEKAIIGETFQKERSLNDAIGENQATESKIANGPISNLRAAIGLNDRFLFIREIFDNNTEKYNTIIENLDKLETIQQAVDYLKANLTLQKNETSMKFVELLKRRFTK